MIWFSFGKWSSSSGRWFVADRLYSPAGWTPFIRYRLRYLKTQKELKKMYPASSVTDPRYLAEQKELNRQSRAALNQRW